MPEVAALESPEREQLTAPLRILVVDDDPVSQRLLQRFLQVERHEVFCARNGREGVDLFALERPDLVFMDLQMPVMDGFEATELILAEADEVFVPIIFLTGMNDDQVLARCLDLGGHDFLTKPYNRTILRAKIEAVRRLQESWKTQQAQKRELMLHRQNMLREQEIASEVLRKMQMIDAIDDPRIDWRTTPMSTFSGDVILSARRPTGEWNVLVVDITGHGLTAALCAMPIYDLFRSMSAKGFALPDILQEMNEKLERTLPTGLFCAAVMMTVNLSEGRVELWNGGLPDVLVRGSGGGIRARVPSHHVPLGILPARHFDAHTQVIELEPGEKLYVYSDGVTEAVSPDGEAFGEARLEELLGRKDAEGVLDLAFSAVARFCAGNAPQDDITLFELSRIPAVESRAAEKGRPSCTHAGARSRWSMAFELDAESLRNFDPLPVLIQSITELHGLAEHKAALFTIASELFNNAVDHGLLDCDSSLKRDPTGFERYYTLRQERLSELRDASVELRFEHAPREGGGEFRIRVSDTGPGFDTGVVSAPTLEANRGHSGRGLPLVRELCERVEYNLRGNSVQAVYGWGCEEEVASD